MQKIEKQIAKDNSIIYNAENINNIIYDNPLKFFCDKEIQNKPELSEQVQVIYYIVNNDVLKKRFGGNNYKYQDLVNFLCAYKRNEINLNPNNLDDGYKSIIQCIIAISSVFELTIQEVNEYLRVKSNDGLIVVIENSGLVFKYNKCINTYEKYVESKLCAEKIIKDLGSYINCATQFGNFFQFNNIYIEDLENVPFIAKEVKFKVSNNIIPNLIKPLYGENPECGLREIIQNACDACKELERKIRHEGICVNKKPIVELYIIQENENWKLIVRDYGIGMDETTLLDKYFIIGESSKKDTNLNLVGQFGIGALAAFLLGDKIEVKTKYIGQDTVLSFEYQLENNQNQNIGISKIENMNFDFGTELSINLNRKYLSIESLEQILKINEWYVMPDVDINYFFNKEPRKMNTFKKDGVIWKSLIEKDGFSVKYLAEAKDIYNNVGKVIYNGIVVQEPYQLNSDYICKKPYVNIVSNNKQIRLNLERSKIESGQDLFIENLRNELITISTDNLKNNCNNIVSDVGIIRRFEYSDNFLRSVPLFFCREGFGIYAKSTINSLLAQGRYDTIIRVYGCKGYSEFINLNQLIDRTIYIFDIGELQKKGISDLIECSGITYIPIETFKSFFYFATDYYSGFRKETMKKIYEEYHINLLVEDKTKAIWDYHNIHKESLFKEILSEPGDIVIGSMENNNPDISLIKKKCRNSIIKIASLKYVTFEDIVDENISIGIV